MVLHVQAAFSAGIWFTLCSGRSLPPLDLLSTGCQPNWRRLLRIKFLCSPDAHNCSPPFWIIIFAPPTKSFALFQGTRMRIGHHRGRVADKSFTRRLYPAVCTEKSVRVWARKMVRPLVCRAGAVATTLRKPQHLRAHKSPFECVYFSMFAARLFCPRLSLLVPTLSSKPTRASVCRKWQKGSQKGQSE